MEDYKKKYEQAMLRMNKWVECSEIIEPKEVAEFVFPELKKSEDEKVREMLLELAKNCGELNFKEVTREQTIAWLEKQGEQKPTDKVKPKFKVGDWVVSPNGVYWHIDAIRDGRYQVSSDSGVSADWPLNTNIYQKFTIQDAKVGDVLYYKSPSGIEYIVMSSGVNRFGNIDSYFRYNSVDGFGISVPSVFNTKEDITPATKEQRDLLFQEMKEAGYEWDSEKKELRKIETNHTWSEEDEKKIDLLIAILEVNHPNGQFKVNPINTLSMEAMSTKEIVDWLKSLKERMKGE